MDRVSHRAGQNRLTNVRLAPPVQQCHLLHRPKLLHDANNALTRRLLLVCAPAGFGKTTLCAQWRQATHHRGAKVGWLTLSELERDTSRFLYFVLLALQSAEIVSGRLNMLVERGIADMDQEFGLTTLIEIVADGGEAVAIVLDDYHLAQSPDVDHLVRQIIAAAPENLHLIIAARERPDVDFPRLLAFGQAYELSTDDLRFSEAETLAVIDPSTQPSVRQMIVEKMEGWPVAVQLANIVLKSGGSDAFNSNLRGQARHIAEYLSAHVLAGLSEGLADFIVKISILDRFSADLVASVLQIEDVHGLLAMLAPLEALVVPLDGHKWFRFHHLFSDYLQERLNALYPKEVPILHKRAAHWFADQGYLTEAVRHAGLSGDTTYCAHLIEEAGGWQLVLSGGTGALSNLLGNLPERDLDRFPRLAVAKAYLCLKVGQIERARSLVARARADLGGASAGPQPQLERDLFNVGALLGMYEDRSYTLAEFVELRQRISAPAKRDPLTVGVMQCVLAAAAIALGQLQEAQEAAKEGMCAMRQAGSVLGLNYTYFHLGIALLYRGHFRLAEEQFLAARALAEKNFGADSGLRDFFEILLTAMAYWRGHLTASRYVAFLEALDRIERFDGICEIFSIASEVEFEFCSHRRDRAGAQLAIDRMQRIADMRGLQRLQSIAQARELRYRVDFGDSGGAHDTAVRLLRTFRKGAWREAPFEWLPYVHVAMSLCEYLAARDNLMATQIAADLIECCENFGANFYLIQAKVLLATLRDKAGARHEAIEIMLQAARLASGNQIRAALTRNERALTLARAAVQKAARADPDCSVACLLKDGWDEQAGAQPPTDSILTAREHDVAAELAQGRSNKEIARALAMSEHTVKFHLKAIFTKLNVKSRAEAAIAIRQRRFVAPHYSNG